MSTRRDGTKRASLVPQASARRMVSAVSDNAAATLMRQGKDLPAE
jgi:hypothetical protein